MRLPSVAFDDFPVEPVKQAGDAVAELLTKAGLPEVRLVDVTRAPQAVFGARPAQPGAPTALLYAHYDVQPPGPGEADKPALRAHRTRRPPVRPRRRRRQGRHHHARRRAHGPGRRLPRGIEVLIEGQEENGQGGIEELVKANEELLKADVIVISDLGNYSLGVPTLTTSLRGMAALDVEVETLEGAVHSGMFGGPAPDALIALTRMIATLHDATGTVAVKGLDVVDYDGAPYDEAAFRADAGVLPGVDLMGAGSIADRLYGRPSINVIGIDAPAVDGAANALIPKARARVSVRLAPGQDPAKARASSPGISRPSPMARPGQGHGRRGRPGLSRPHRRAGLCRRHRCHGSGLPEERRALWRGRLIPLVAAFLEAQPTAEMILWGCEEPQCRIHAPNESVDLAELERMVLAEALFSPGWARRGEPHQTVTRRR